MKITSVTGLTLKIFNKVQSSKNMSFANTKIITMITSFNVNKMSVACSDP